jgi:hypothetical protein
MTGTWMALVIALWAVVLVLLVLVLGLSRRLQELSENSRQAPVPVLTGSAGSVRGPLVGSTIDLLPPSTPGVDGEPAKHRIVLILNSSCGPCHMLGDEVIAAKEDGFVFDSDLVLITDEFGAEFYGGLGAGTVIVEPSNEVSRSLGVNATPYGLAVDATGVVRWSGVAGNFDDVLSMAAAVGLDVGGDM